MYHVSSVLRCALVYISEIGMLLPVNSVSFLIGYVIFFVNVTSDMDHNL